MYETNYATIELKEVSLLIQPFKIEGELIQVVMDDSENQTQNQSEDNEVLSNNFQKKSSSKGKYYYGYGTNSGSGSTGGSVRYTPKIQIPRTGIKYTIYDTMTTRNMEKGVAILSTDNGLNQPGNTVISGHNRLNGRLFSKNERLQLGDIIYITDETGEKIAYVVTNKYITTPNDASYMERDTEGGREISLTTCTDDGANRLIIWASEP